MLVATPSSSLWILPNMFLKSFSNSHVLILIHALRIRFHPVDSDFFPYSDDRFWIYSTFSCHWFRKIIIFRYRPTFWETYKTGPKKRPLENVSKVNFITKFILNFSFIYDFWRELCSSTRDIALTLQGHLWFVWKSHN